ncbi:MAG: hypothetical protein U9Q15_02335 [Patescibacteria group bacterium]|nr:hypothetical protein [Patescibacteria group bacterium]
MVELELEENELYPVKTFNLLQGGSKDESIDSLSALLAPLSNLDHKQETIIFQYILTPEHEKWKESSHKLELAIEKQETIANKIASASKFPLLLNIALLPFSILVKIIQKLGKKEENTEEEQKESKGLSDKDKGKIQALQQKEEKPAFRCIIRAAYLRKDQDKSFSKTKMQSITGSFRQFNSQHNSFIHKKPFLKEGLWGKKRDLSFKEIYSLLKTRSFNKPGILLNIEEIASVYHLPNTNVNVPNIQYTPYQKLEAPVNLPTPENTDEALTMMGYTNFRNQKKLFGMTPNDRRRHLYVI